MPWMKFECHSCQNGCILFRKTCYTPERCLHASSSGGKAEWEVAEDKTACRSAKTPEWLNQAMNEGNGEYKT